MNIIEIKSQKQFDALPAEMNEFTRDGFECMHFDSQKRRRVV